MIQDKSNLRCLSSGQYGEASENGADDGGAEDSNGGGQPDESTTEQQTTEQVEVRDNFKRSCYGRLY